MLVCEIFQRGITGGKKGREKLEAAEEEVFHGFLTGTLRLLKRNRTLLEKVLSGMNATDLLFDLNSYYSSTFPIDV